jgi:hypothetical protein
VEVFDRKCQIELPSRNDWNAPEKLLPIWRNLSLTWKGLSPKELQGLAPNKLWDGWILGDGDRVPARGPQFGLILLPVRKVRKGTKE